MLYRYTPGSALLTAQTSYLTKTYKDVNIIVESDVADEIENDLDAVLYTGKSFTLN